jgi:hypothetical protein
MDRFDAMYFAQLRGVISEGHWDSFRLFVRTMAQGPHTLGSRDTNFENYHFEVISDLGGQYQAAENRANVSGRIRQLSHDAHSATTPSGVAKVQSTFDELRREVEPLLSDDARKRCEEIAARLTLGVERAFKGRRLDEIIFGVGAFCLFKQRVDWLGYMWGYTQPADAGAYYTGPGILPESLDKLLAFFFGREVLNRLPDFWEERHGAEQYYKEYFLLLAARFVHRETKAESGAYPAIANISLTQMDPNHASRVKYHAEKMQQVIPILLKSGALSLLSLSAAQQEELASEQLPALLNSIIEKCEARLVTLEQQTSVATERIDRYRQDVLRGFTENAKVRALLDSLSLIDDISDNDPPSGAPGLGVSALSPKGAFLDQWHVHYMNWGSDTGRNIAISEDRHLLVLMRSGSNRKTLEAVANALDRHDKASDFILLALNCSPLLHLRGDPRFGVPDRRGAMLEAVPLWRLPSTSQPTTNASPSTSSGITSATVPFSS